MHAGVVVEGGVVVICGADVGDAAADDHGIFAADDSVDRYSNYRQCQGSQQALDEDQCSCRILQADRLTKASSALPDRFCILVNSVSSQLCGVQTWLCHASGFMIETC